MTLIKAIEAAPLGRFLYMYSNPTQPAAQVYGQANNIYNQGQQGAAQATQQYGANQQQYQDYANQLESYQNNLPDLGQLYKQNVGEAESQYGINPQALLQANQALAATQATMNQLPQAIQQSANGYGLTAAQEANRYAGAANNLQTALGNQTAGVNAYQQSIQNALGQAQVGTGLTGQTEQMRMGAMGQLIGAAQAQEQQAISQIQYYRGLEQQGVALTEGEQQQLSAAESAAAQAESAAAAMMQAQTGRMAFNLQAGGPGGSNYNVNPLTGQQKQPTVQVPGQENDLIAFFQNLANPANRSLNIGQFLGGAGNDFNSILGQLGI